MDVDEKGSASAEAGVDSQALVDELGQVLEQVAAEPNNLRLLRRQVVLMVDLGMADEAADTAKTSGSILFLGEELWLRILDARISSAARPVTLDSFPDILELFQQAQGEYLSANILARHARFLVDLVSPPEGEIGADDEVKEYLNAETLRDMLRDIARRADGLLSTSQEVWKVWLDWEVARVATSSGEERPAQIAHVHTAFLERLKIPHSTLDETSSAYSTFCSEHCPEEYEDRLVQATNASQTAKWKWEREKRYGKTRVDFEEQLAAATDVTQQATILLAYLDWETDPTAKKNQGAKGPRQDISLCRAVFERLLLVYSNTAYTADDASYAAAAVPEMEQQMKIGAAYKSAEATIWSRYFDWVSGNTTPKEEDNPPAEVAQRATKACPASGEVWANELSVMEEVDDVPDIERTVEKARALIIANAQPVSSLVGLLYAHASILHRRYRDLEATLEHPVFLNLAAALDLMVSTYPDGDDSLRLEKFFLTWAEAEAAELIPGVVAVMDKRVKWRDASSQFAVLIADIQARHGDTEAAREVYNKAVGRYSLNWPEAVFEAFVNFESVYGTRETVVAARGRVAREEKKLAKRREKAGQEQLLQQQAEYAEQLLQQQAAYAAEQTAAAPAAAAAAPTEVPVAAANEAMAVDTQAAQSAAAPAPPEAPAKEEHAEGETQPRRDREHSTVLVTGLKKGATSDRVTAFFAEAGEVKECTMLPGDQHDAAMVEFVSADSVPLALDKDGKKVDGNTIRVSMLWRSTLYVTNFSPTTDDAALRELFGQYGRILQTRWPSRKFKDNRRFCYITMESPAAAQEALVLHKFTPAGERWPLSVLVSDPSHRTKRTNYSDSTLFVGGLNSKTTEGEVRHLLESYGTILSIKLPWDREKNACKGIAFVEMQNKAQAEAALAANGKSYRGKKIKVTMSDPNHANKKQHGKPQDAQEAADRRGRTVYLFDIPEGSQEGLLQQELEKIVPVKRVELFAGKGEARVQLDSAADAGRLLMRIDPFVFNGATIRISDSAERKAAPAPKPAAAMAASTSGPQAQQTSLSFQPRIRKTNKPLGQAYRPPKAAAATAAAVPAPTPGASGQDAFRAFMNATNDERKKADEERKRAAEERRAEAAAAREAAAKAAEAIQDEGTAAAADGDSKKHALEDRGEGGDAKRTKRAE